MNYSQCSTTTNHYSSEDTVSNIGKKPHRLAYVFEDISPFSNLTDSQKEKVGVGYASNFLMYSCTKDNNTVSGVLNLPE